MAGHSHWAQIKHKKAKVDAQRGKLFSKIIREITVAVREGGPNPETNSRLRTAIENARRVNMPAETIERAIKKGAGELGGESYEEVLYEGYGPGGAAIMVMATTDNRNRTTAEIRHVFSKYGGNLGSSGCVSYMFERVGYMEVPKEGLSEDVLYEKAIEAGAEDIETGETSYIIYTKPEMFYTVKDSLLKENIPVENATITYKPLSTVQITDPETAKKLIKLLDALDELDDVQNVISNFDIPEEVLRASA
ncbi:MAG: YebC/PmpR family DNA-binding transcriptional regulator [Hydrogenobacter thermophilus]|uniref:YebC/PmpR family DNA-binding transcriptional regulator n=1 Tax=Hydrogenobacter thermophilus TaxID=940 RepID=UPI001C768612|nr:YebC/PmpR family DNA-binding transcriptional regulator [Hydrogenobacter thermophilus]MCS7284497.1 YebC/PmpR family DNA-binding transcriptional regulator [Hydrogenobacter thermophilus]QWK19575.1 MAG: YebC/PmpR family DNA-binding transcriptional regulator [Hydrogenobacter thermophilus]